MSIILPLHHASSGVTHIVLMRVQMAADDDTKSLMFSVEHLAATSKLTARIRMTNTAPKKQPAWPRLMAQLMGENAKHFWRSVSNFCPELKLNVKRGPVFALLKGELTPHDHTSYAEKAANAEFLNRRIRCLEYSIETSGDTLTLAAHCGAVPLTGYDVPVWGSDDWSDNDLNLVVKAMAHALRML